MRHYTKYIPLLACSFLMTGGALYAQKGSDTTIANQTIEITQTYKPEIAKPAKPAITPSLPRVDTTKPKFQYEVPQQTLSYTYHSVPIRPLALGRQDATMPFQNYVKAGYGNLSSLYLDAGVGSVKTSEYEAAAHFSHLSQKGDVENQQSSRTNFDASGKYYTSGHAITGSFNFLRNGNTLYGYDHDTYDYQKSAILQAFTGAGATIGAENITPNKFNIWYKPVLGIGIYGDKFGGKERYFAFDVPASMPIDDSSLTFNLGLKGNFTRFTNNTQASGNNYFQVNPSFDIIKPKTNIHLGVSPTWGKDNTCYLLPDIAFNTRIFKKGLALIAGWKSLLNQNTFQELSTKNPFLSNNYNTKQTISDQIYGGFESAFGKHISFGGTVSWRQYKDLALFVNDYTASKDGKVFDVVYDSKVQALSFDAFIRYQVGNLFGLSANASYYNFYKTTTFDKAYQEPAVRMSGNLYFHPLEQLHLGVNMDFWDGLYARNEDGSTHKMPAFLDMSANAEYNFIPRLSAFVQLNNILGSHYQRWNQYDSYGFNIIAGIRFKF
jgi:hypothetical protein